MERALGVAPLKSRSLRMALIKAEGKTKWQQATGQNRRPNAKPTRVSRSGTMSRSSPIPRSMPKVPAAKRLKWKARLEARHSQVEDATYGAYNSAYDWCCSMPFWQHHYLRCMLQCVRGLFLFLCVCVCVCNWHVTNNINNTLLQ